MNLPFNSPPAADEIVTLFLVILLAFFFLRERLAKKTLAKHEEEQKQRIYQISILKEIQDRISYSLDVEEVIDIITGSLKNLFPYSTASAILIEGDKLVFKTYIEERISQSFLEEVKKSMLASISALVPGLPESIEERHSGQLLDENNQSPLASFFHIPFIVNNKVAGLINVSSTTPQLYKEQEVTMLYQITDNASNALSRLHGVLEVEKGKLTSLITGLVDGVFMVDGKNQVLIINDAAKKFLNLQNNQTNFIDIVNSLAGKYDLQAKIKESVSKNTTLEEKEVIIGANTFQIFVTPVVNTLISDKPQVIGASILIHDITIEKNISKIKEDFTNMMVHELRAPLTAIKDSSELMLEEKNIKEAETKQLLGIIDSQSKTLLEQIGSILDAAKIEAGRFVIQKSPNDLNKLINDVADTFSVPAMKKKIEISSYVPKELPLFSFDLIRINQVLNNLVSNSLKFTPEGGKITVLGEINENSITVSVSDTGMGIGLEDQKDLFSKFYQIKKTPGELAKKGTGLGLYIVKGVVEAHGGTVGVKSDVGQGTTIYFTLPLSDDLIRQQQKSPLPSTFSTVN